MRILSLAILLSCLISGCATVEPAVNPWAEAQRAEGFATYPVPIPELESDLSNLDEVLEATLANYDIAEANAQSLEDISRAYNDLLSAGDAEFQLSEFRLQMLEAERKARLWDKLSTWSILALLGVASAL
jgi:hypothetical protein